MMGNDNCGLKGKPHRAATQKEEDLLTVCEVTLQSLREWYADLAERDETKRKLLDALIFQLEVMLESMGIQVKKKQ
ncbi:MAG: hypothetical protein AB7G93_20120 [Bdellovibrionales bacterium]